MTIFRTPNEPFARLTEFPFPANYRGVTVEGIELQNLAPGEDGAGL